MKTADTQGMSPEEIAVMAEMDPEGLPPEDELEKLNATTLRRDEGAPDVPGANDPPAAPAPPAPPAPPAVAETPAAPTAEQLAAEATAAALTAAAASLPPAPPAQVLRQVDVPADADDRIAAAQALINKAFTDAMENTIETAEYNQVLNEQQKVIKGLEELKLTAKLAADWNKQAADAAAEAEWHAARGAIFSEAKQAGLDYEGNKVLFRAFNATLQELGRAAEKGENKLSTAAEFFAEAHRLTAEGLGVVLKARTNAPAPPSRHQDMNALPPTLARVPPAADVSTGANEFAHMDGLSGVDAERAYERLTAEQKERYLD